MADLVGTQADLPVGITGLTPTGVPTNPVNADANGNLYVKDILLSATQMKSLSVSTTAVQALGGASILADRKTLIICPTGGTIYWGNSSSVTTATGFPIFPNQTVMLSVSSAISIYLIAAAATTTIVFEGS